jgi:hypothetical protein
MRKHPQVVITRKDKRIRHKLLHAVAFAVTGGTSGIVTAAEAANHAGYNARTRKLQAEAEAGESTSLTAQQRIGAARQRTAAAREELARIKAAQGEPE